MLAEQYDAFVKFTHDQIMRRYGEQPASCEYRFPPLPAAALGDWPCGSLHGRCLMLGFSEAPRYKCLTLSVWRVKVERKTCDRMRLSLKTRSRLPFRADFQNSFGCCHSRFAQTRLLLTALLILVFFLFADVSWITFSAYVGCPIHPVLLLQAVPVMTCSNAIFFPPVNTGYFKLLSVATTLMQQLVLECSLMSVPPGCGPLLPVIIPVASFAVSLQFGFLC